MVSLPTPNAQEVAQFKELFFKHRGVMLSDEAALDAATRWAHLMFFGTTPCTDSTSESQLKKMSDRRSP
jgi:hypothetical protein